MARWCPVGPPTLDLWGNHRCLVAKHVVATHRWHPGPENLAADQRILFHPPRASPVGRLGTAFLQDYYRQGYRPSGWVPDPTQQGQNARGSILRPLCMPPPQQAARYPERARRGEGYRKARAFGEKGIAPGPSGLYHYFGRRTEIAGPYRNARET